MLYSISCRTSLKICRLRFSWSFTPDPKARATWAGILTRAGWLPARYARDGEKFEQGTIYVASPDHHLLLTPGERVLVVRGPRENRMRPAIDPLFRSAALAYGARVIGVVLSGGLDDGTAGLRGIKMCGGTTIVQDPAAALDTSMPSSVLFATRASTIASHRLNLPLIVQLTQGEAPEPTRLENNMKKLMEIEVEAAKRQRWSGYSRSCRSVPVYLPGMSRCAAAREGSVSSALSLPHRACFYGGQPGE
jgi:two-component system, chemotaxis family, protein-glutamate methylesterase/glutaminase